MINAVIFDFGGVIVDITDTGSTAEIAAAMGQDKETFKRLHGPVVQKMATGLIDEDGYWREVSELTGKPRPNNWLELWSEKARKNSRLIPGMADLVAELKAKGIRCIVLSNAIPPHMKIARDNGWYDMFDKLYLSAETGYYKPDIRAYTNLLEAEKLRAEECVFVDDMEANLEPAEKLGIQTILAIYPEETIRLIQQSVGSEI